MCRTGAHVFVGNLGAMFDHVDKRHSMAPTEPKVFLQPLEDNPGLGFRILKALFTCELNQLVGRLPGLIFYCV